MSRDTQILQLYEIAKRNNCLDDYFQQLLKINNTINADQQLKNSLYDYNLTDEQKKAAITEKTGELSIVSQHYFEPDKEAIYQFIKKYYQEIGFEFGTIYSVGTLTEEEIAQVEATVSKRTGMQVKLENVIDSSILGGLKVVVGGYVFDNTYSYKLQDVRKTLIDTTEDSAKALDNYDAKAVIDVKDEYNSGYVMDYADGVLDINGLKNAVAGELLKVNDTYAMVMNLEENGVKAVILGKQESVYAGAQATTTGRVVEVPVGDAMLGRVVNALGEPIDGKGVILTSETSPIEVDAPSIIDRQGVCQSMETGLKIVDSMIPIGKGQRELIIGDRQTGKTSIAIDSILNQKGKNVFCIYVAIGQKNSTVAQIVEKLNEHGAMEYTTVVVSGASEPAALQYIAPYAGTSIGEYWMKRGGDVLIVYDDLSKHAVAYRTLSLLLRRPPGREAYPGDVFYLHSRLLERSGKLSDALGGGSMTALPIVETQAGDISAYIPTNVISITDGQLFLQTELFNSGNRPAVDSGLSVSRVGSSAQSKAMKKVSGSLKLDLAQYQEVLGFAQFGSDLDAATKKMIDHGQHLMELLKQPQYSPFTTPDMIIILLANQNGSVDRIEIGKIADYQKYLLKNMHSNHKEDVAELTEKLEFKGDLQKRLSDDITAVTDEYLTHKIGG